VGYAKGNALGREGWESDEALDEHLVWWMLNVADTRIHGTTGEKPIDRFPAEKAALRSLNNHPSYLRVSHLSRRVAADAERTRMVDEAPALTGPEMVSIPATPQP
jgi:hypothetical protein